MPDRAVIVRSTAPPLTAATTPITMPTTALKSVSSTASAAVTGSRFAMSGPIGRPSMSETLTQEHMRTLRAVGTPTTRIIYVHALRGASLPILASVAIQFIVLFGGSVVIEVLFALPGIGQAMQAAVGSADLPFVQALVLVATVVVVLVNLVLELLNRALDPKLRAS